MMLVTDLAAVKEAGKNALAGLMIMMASSSGSSSSNRAPTLDGLVGIRGGLVVMMTMAVTTGRKQDRGSVLLWEFASGSSKM